MTRGKPDKTKNLKEGQHNMSESGSEGDAVNAHLEQETESTERVADGQSPGTSGSSGTSAQGPTNNVPNMFGGLDPSAVMNQLFGNFLVQAMQQPQAFQGWTPNPEPEEPEDSDSDDEAGSGKGEKGSTKPLPPGKLAEILKSKKEKHEAKTKKGTDIDENLVPFFDTLFSESRTRSDLDMLHAAYPQPENAGRIVVPELEPVLQVLIEKTKNASFQKEDEALKKFQTHLVKALLAWVPFITLWLKRGDSDDKLDARSEEMSDGLQLIVSTVKALSKRRKDLLKPMIIARYGDQFLKKGGDDPNFLFGGNLEEAVKTVDSAHKLADRIEKPPQQQQAAPGKAKTSFKKNQQQQRHQSGYKKKHGNQGWPRNQNPGFFFPGQRMPYMIPQLGHNEPPRFTGPRPQRPKAPPAEAAGSAKQGFRK